MGLSTYTHFNHRLDVVARQLSTLDNPNTDLFEKVTFFYLFGLLYFFCQLLKYNPAQLNIGKLWINNIVPEKLKQNQKSCWHVCFLFVYALALAYVLSSTGETFCHLCD